MYVCWLETKLEEGCFYVLKWKARQTVLYPVALPRRGQSSPMTNPIHLAPHKQIIWEDFWKEFLGTRNYQWLLKLLFGSGIWLTFPWSNQVTRNMMWVRESTPPQRAVATNWGQKCRWLITQSVKILPAVQETSVRFLGWEDPLEKG